MSDSRNDEIPLAIFIRKSVKSAPEITNRESPLFAGPERSYTMTVKKRETIMLRLSVLIMATLLSACSVLQGTPQPAPPPTNYPQEVQRSQTAALTKTGTVTAVVSGSPVDSEAIIKKKAAAAKADYYLIIMNDETIIPGQWYAQAILYRK